jgi:hypothetical protein
MAVMTSEQVRRLQAALQALVEHARPAFPKTPYAVALKTARELLKELEGQS